MLRHTRVGTGLGILALTLVISGLLAAYTWAQVLVPSGVPTEAPGVPVSLGVPATQLTVTGCAARQAFVTLFNNADLVGTVVANNSGQFSKSIIVDDPGLQTVKLYYQDLSGRISSTVTKNVSASAQTNTFLDMFLPSTVDHEPSFVVAGGLIVFRGSTCPNAQVSVVIDNNFTASAQADNRGDWVAVVDTDNFFAGQHSYGVVAKVGPDLSEPSQKGQFTVTGKTTEPQIEPDSLSAPFITSPVDGFLSGSRRITIRGSGPANSQIQLFVDDQIRGSAFASSTGEWLIEFTTEKPDHTVYAKACVEDICSESSNVIRVGYRGDLASCGGSLRLARYQLFDLRPNQGFNLDLAVIEGLPDYELLIDWGDSTVDHVSQPESRPISFHHIYSDSGHYNGVLAARDSRQCTYLQYFSAAVLPPSSLTWPRVGAVPFGIGAVWLVSFGVRRMKMRRNRRLAGDTIELG